MTSRLWLALALVCPSFALGCGDDDTPADAAVDARADDSTPDADTPDVDEPDTDAPDAVVDATDDAALDADPEDTWTNYAEAFMATYCVECHDGMTGAGRDYTDLAEVRGEAMPIRCGTSDVTLEDCSAAPRARQFPIGSGPLPEDAERARFVAWIDAGLPE